jgi:hypothetical protein
MGPTCQLLTKKKKRLGATRFIGPKCWAGSAGLTDLRLGLARLDLRLAGQLGMMGDGSVRRLMGRLVSTGRPIGS